LFLAFSWVFLNRLSPFKKGHVAPDVLNNMSKIHSSRLSGVKVMSILSVTEMFVFVCLSVCPLFAWPRT